MLRSTWKPPPHSLSIHTYLPGSIGITVRVTALRNIHLSSIERSQREGLLLCPPVQEIKVQVRGSVVDRVSKWRGVVLLAVSRRLGPKKGNVVRVLSCSITRGEMILEECEYETAMMGRFTCVNARGVQASVSRDSLSQQDE